MLRALAWRLRIANQCAAAQASRDPNNGQNVLVAQRAAATVERIQLAISNPSTQTYPAAAMQEFLSAAATVLGQQRVARVYETYAEPWFFFGFASLV